MKMADILHSIADMLSQHEQEEGGENMGQQGSDFQHAVHDGAESGTKEADVGVMIPPLQQKLEILKKSAGMENAFDQGSDELDDIKKLTGVNAVMQHEASEDNDIVG
jgi:hypothetical protein